MDPAPDFGADSYKGSGKLKGKVSTQQPVILSFLSTAIKRKGKSK
jgi:hypothetical protein